MKPLTNDWTDEELRKIDLPLAVADCMRKAKATREAKEMQYWTRLAIRCHNLHFDLDGITEGFRNVPARNIAGQSDKQSDSGPGGEKVQRT